MVYEGTRLSGSESSETKITAFSFDPSNEANAIVVEQPVIKSDNTITFRVDEAAVKANPDLLKALVPTFTISDKATSSVKSGVAMDLSQDVAITLYAENGTKVLYTVKSPTQSSVLKYTFDEWKTAGTSITLHDEPLPDDQLASSVQGAALLALFGITDRPVYKSEDDKVAGAAAIKLVTMDTSAKTSTVVPAMTSGSVFTGVFNSGPAMTDRMKCTEFGIPYNRKPVLFKGYYKYKAGEKFVDGEGATKPADVKVIEGKVDECSIMAVLYETELDANGKNIPLNGHDISDSPRRVAVAALADGTDKAEWTPFSLEFKYLDGKTYDASKEYQLAIVCSSSKEGAAFKGAGGSTLMLDEFEVIGE
ncbi:MAG: PCMD domain-containing protein [Bacteroides sp.]|nr:PCMD domain-containing protein [Bacteroides sp.]